MTKKRTIHDAFWNGGVYVVAMAIWWILAYAHILDLQNNIAAIIITLAVLWIIKKFVLKNYY